MMMPDNRSTAESTRLDMIAIEEDRPTATALAINSIYKDKDIFLVYQIWRILNTCSWIIDFVC